MLEADTQLRLNTRHGGIVDRMDTPLRIGLEEDQMLDELAESLGMSKDQAVAAIIRDAWERNRRNTHTRAILDDLSVERKNLLDRLSQ